MTFELYRPLSFNISSPRDTLEESWNERGNIMQSLYLIFQDFAKDNPPLEIKESAFNTIDKDNDRFWKRPNWRKYFRFKEVPEDFTSINFAPLSARVKKLKRDQVDIDQKPFPSSKDLFNCTYRDPGGAVKHFASYLEGCADEFHENSDGVSSPFVALVQSSFYGKSRLALEVARSQVRTVYTCLRDANSTEYPVRTEGAFTHLFTGLNDLDSGEDFSTILADRMKRLISSALTNLNDPREVNGTIHNPLQGLGTEDATKFPSELISDKLWNDHLLKPWTQEDQFPANNTGTRTSGLVALVIDEARYTLKAKSPDGVSLFRYIRNAARIVGLSLPEHLRFVVALLDTSPRIFQIMPSTESGSVSVSLDADRRAHFSPYIYSQSFDVNFEPELSTKSTNLKKLITSKKWLSAGRPIMKWASQEDSMLVNKLQGGRTAETMESVDQVAVMLARVGARIHLHHPLALELVERNMATLLDANDAGDQFLTRFASEPVLARAAGKIWDKEGLLESALLPALHKAMMSEAFKRNRDGEEVAQIVILLAFDAACKEVGKEGGEAVPLRLVIKQLLPLGVADEDIILDNCIPPHLRDAKIACCQFMNLRVKLTLEAIVYLAERHTGGVLKEGDPGPALILPVLFDEIAAVIVQVKACPRMLDAEYPNSAGAYLRPKHAFEKSVYLSPDISQSGLESNCVRIYMQLGAKSPRKYVICHQVEQDALGKPYPLQMFGLMSRCIKPGVKECLEYLLIDHRTVKGLLELKRMQAISWERRTGLTSNDPQARRPFICFIDEDEDDFYADLSVVQLRAALREIGLKSTGGKKADLIQRLEDDDINQVQVTSSH